MAGINGDAGWDNWDWLPSNPSLSSPPAACHLADEDTLVTLSEQKDCWLSVLLRI